ncbi:hypothetical protein P8C59_004183 [Phyllachora maydis]|uniref:FAD-binding FR-type domain-containing protein n=1 Tax=Phyllachora maydis TaxID=1825666 RepID=A0AAD9I2W4_9PEZI|nr:hypothetical protein P8C59_004183 [Phyllachora maydis]
MMNLKKHSKLRPRTSPSSRGLLLHFSVGLCATAGLGLLVFFWRAPDPVRSLNDKTFAPYRVVSSEPISPTNFVLTVEPASPSTPVPDALGRAWRHGTFSVEIKQPEIQVAREYTPLPPAPDDPAAGHPRRLRFLVRALAGGEVSTYLGRLRAGDSVELRGPHLGPDVRARLGRHGPPHHVVFVAGGTGIAPALQVAGAVLDGDPAAPAHPAADPAQPRVAVIWANRQRADCAGCEALEAPTSASALGPVMRQLADLKRRHGPRFSVVCTVDEERRFIDATTILEAAGAVVGAQNRRRQQQQQQEQEQEQTRRVDDQDDMCRYHGRTATAWSTGQDPPQRDGGRARDGHGQGCVCADGSGGRNLLLVSGPEGFVAHFAGPKVWAQGRQLQGEVRGVVGELMAKRPDFWADWLVLKL